MTRECSLDPKFSGTTRTRKELDIRRVYFPSISASGQLPPEEGGALAKAPDLRAQVITIDPKPQLPLLQASISIS
jgi:hypothetical protein